MQLTRVAPSGPLAAWVECLWSVDGISPHRGEIVLPNGAIELIVNLGSFHKVVDRAGRRSLLYKKAWVAGIQERPLEIAPVHETRLMGVRFRPGGAHAFLGFPVSELTNRVAESDALLGPAIERLRDRLCETRCEEDRMRLLEVTIAERLSRASPDRAVRFAVDQLCRSMGRASISRLRAETGLTHKTFIARFRRQVGVSPKMLARILRLRSVIGSVRARAEVNWADVAIDCGYYDQAHLINEFRALTGATPREYLRRRDADENHMIVE